MEIDKLRTVISEAYRFIRAARDVERSYELGGREEIYNGKDTAACKRASLDLTRALAELRK